MERAKWKAVGVGVLTVFGGRAVEPLGLGEAAWANDRLLPTPVQP